MLTKTVSVCRMNYHSLLAITALICLGAHSPTPAEAVVAYRAVALSGEQVPGAEPGVVFSTFSSPSLNASGQVIVKGQLAGTGVVNGVNDGGLWLDSGTGPQLVLRTAEPAPQTEPGVLFQSIGGHHINDGGEILIGGRITGPGLDGNDSGIWLIGDNGFNLVIRARYFAPGTGGEFTSIYTAKFNDADQISILANITGTGINSGNDLGIWSAEPGAFNFVARSGDTVFDSTTSTLFNLGFERYDLSFNASGQSAIRGVLSGPGVDTTNDSSIWIGKTGEFTLLAREGTHAPGTAAGEYYRIFERPVIYDAQTSVFMAVLGGPGVGENNQWGLWAQRNGAVSLMARGGQPAPGTASGVTFLDFDKPAINGNGDTVFIARLRGETVTPPTNAGIWLDRGDGPQMIFRTGDPAPGTEPGVVFMGDITTGPLINSHGQIAFRALLNGPGITGLNDIGLWATDLAGHIKLIAREGDPFDVNPDPFVEELKTIKSLIYADARETGNNGLSPSFNDAGQLAFRLNFTDGTSGIFVATLGLPGDLDGDGFVGIDDLNIVLGNWNQEVPPANLLADPNGDRFVGIDDLNAVLGNWNSGTPPPPSSVPEPASLWLLGIGGLVSCRRRVA